MSKTSKYIVAFHLFIMYHQLILYLTRLYLIYTIEAILVSMWTFFQEIKLKKHVTNNDSKVTDEFRKKIYIRGLFIRVF